MICSNCLTDNEAHAAYCRHCGSPLAIVPMPETGSAPSKVVGLFTGYVGAIAAQSLFAMVMSSLSNIFSAYWLYRMMSFTFGIAGIVLLILLVNNVKHRNARLWLVVCLIIQCLAFIFWSAVPLLRGQGSFRF